MWRDLLLPTAARTRCITGLIVPGLVLGALPCLAQHAPSRPPSSAQALAQRVDAYVAPYVRMRDFGGVVLVARGGRVFGRPRVRPGQLRARGPRVADNEVRHCFGH